MASWKTNVAGVEMLHLNIILYTASTPLIKRVEKFYKLHNRIFHHSDSVWMILLPVLHVCVSRSVISDSLWPHELQPAKLLCPWDSPGKNTGMGCHFLLQRIFLTQGLNSGLLHCRQILYHLNHQESSLAFALKKSVLRWWWKRTLPHPLPKETVSSALSYCVQDGGRKVGRRDLCTWFCSQAILGLTSGMRLCLLTEILLALSALR